MDPPLVSRPLRAAGIAAWIFAVTANIPPVVVLFLELVISPGASGMGGTPGPQVVLGPPAELMLAVLASLSVPWFIAGGLSLWGIRGAKWMNLILSLPTAVVVLFAGGGGIAALSDLENQGMWAPAAYLSSLALTGAAFVFFAWRDAWQARHSQRLALQ